MASEAGPPVGVVDIGSNSIRLVVYEAAKRTPVVVFNEKVMCGIGRSLVTTGRLDEAGVERALLALARFRVIAREFGVGRLDVVATAAARDAENGSEFVLGAQAAIGCPIRILSGAEEARLAALGVIAGTPDALGLVGDLGGGSLELSAVSEGRVGEGVTLPLGPLRLAEDGDTSTERARAIAAAALARVTWLGDMRGRALYAVGGAWRSFARVHMDKNRHPLHILHAYAIPRADALDFSRFIANQSRKSLERIADVSRRRLELMPYAAAVLGEVVAQSGVDTVIVSAYGLREGLLFDGLPAEAAAADPLVEATAEIAARESRDPAFTRAVFGWARPLFPDEGATEQRLRLAACHLSDIAWRVHPDYRADRAFHEVLTASFAGLTHPERARLALALHHRYTGDTEPDRLGKLAQLLDPLARAWAQKVGLSLRLAYALTAGRPGLLRGVSLSLAEGALVLRLGAEEQVLLDDRVERSFVQLAKLLQLRTEIVRG
ncbi:MAG: Ppx/GppA family phosphatase [Alphaproteobacteria bacterium]|nr:Ppx/GppA family phosphatase [Alphaproteobacteria bacterium]